MNDKWPQHQSPERGAPTATAPYNFVPLPESVFLPKEESQPFVHHDRLVDGRLHGWIDLEITTETSTYTRCAYPPIEESREVVQSKPRQEPYHHGDPTHPVLPGSSLRGMVRSLVEILSYARLSRRGPDREATRLLDKALVHRFVADQLTPAGKAYQQRFVRDRGRRELDYPGPNIHAGYLVADGRDFAIRPAQVHQGVSFVRVDKTLVRAAGIAAREPDKVDDVFVAPEPPALHERSPVGLHYAKTDQITQKPASGLVRGVLVCSGPMATKTMHAVVYGPDHGKPLLPIAGEVWDAFRADRDMPRGKDPRYRKVQPNDPCFYLLENGRVTFLGPVMFFRIPYDKKTADFVPEALMAGGGLDLAEALFGTVNPGDRGKDDEAGAHRGRVRFDDARMKSAPDNQPFLGGPRDDGRRTPAILSTPKPTSYQHYLVQTKRTGDARALKTQLKTYWSEPVKATVLRGHKIYWHRGEPTKDELSPQKPEIGDTQRTVVRPVRPRVVFTGKVRFENLTFLELGALLCALELPEGCRHHFGMGKPHGMGSIRVAPALHLVDPRARYASLSATGERTVADTAAAALKARETFRRAILEHHNGAVESPKLPAGEGLWGIPRLDALRRLLQWDGRPASRQATRYMTIEPNEYRNRPVLPTPAGVQGDPDPKVVADIPSSGGPETASAAKVPPVVPRAEAPLRAVSAPAPPAARRTIGGRIVYYSQGFAGVLLDGETKTRRVQLHLHVFSREDWKKLDGNELHKGRQVNVELEGDEVRRVAPVVR